MGIGSSPLHFRGDSRDGRPGCCIRWVGDDGEVEEGGIVWTLLRSTVPEIVLCCRACREDGGPAYLAWPGLWPCSAPLRSPGGPLRHVAGREAGRTQGRRACWRCLDRARWQHPALGTQSWSGFHIHCCCQHLRRTARATCHIHEICEKIENLTSRH